MCATWAAKIMPFRSVHLAHDRDWRVQRVLIRDADASEQVALIRGTWQHEARAFQCGVTTPTPHACTAQMPGLEGAGRRSQGER